MQERIDSQTSGDIDFLHKEGMLRFITQRLKSQSINEVKPVSIYYVSALTCDEL